MSILKKFKMNKDQNGGYSLIEVIFVIAVTGILAGISIPSLINWKYFQDIKTRQLALRTNIEQMKSDAKRWGATCTIDGKTLKSSCTSAVIQKTITDTFDSQSTKEVRIKPTVSNLKENSTGKLVNEDNYFTATNFNKITFSPRGFIHVNPIHTNDSNAVFVLGYRSNKDPIKSQSAELCVKIENLTGRTSVKRRDSKRLGRVKTMNKVYAKSALTC